MYFILLTGGPREVTSAAFGGEDLQDLYLTTAREGFDEAKGKDFPWLGAFRAGHGCFFFFSDFSGTQRDILKRPKSGHGSTPRCSQWSKPLWREEGGTYYILLLIPRKDGVDLWLLRLAGSLFVVPAARSSGSTWQMPASKKHVRDFTGDDGQRIYVHTHTQTINILIYTYTVHTLIYTIIHGYNNLH